MLKKIGLIILIAFPPGLIAGPLISDAIVTISSLLFFYFAWKNNLWHWLKSPLVACILIFWAFIVCRSLISIDPLLSLESSLFYGRFIFFALFIRYYVLWFTKFQYYFSISLWLSMGVVTLDAYLQYFTGTNLLGWQQLDPYRISGLFDDEYILGSYLSRLMPLGFYFLAIKPNLKPSIMFFAMCFVIVVDVLIYVSGERTAFFYLFLGTFLIVLLIQRFRIIRFFAFSVSLILIVILTYFIPHVKGRMIDHTLDDIGLNKTSEKINLFSPKHQDHYTSAFLMFKNNPFFGQGTKLFRKLCKEEKYYPIGCDSHPHNTYIQLLAEVGFIGAIPFIVIFILIGAILIRQFFFVYFSSSKKIVSDSTICLLICFFISFWPLVPTGNIFNNWLNSIYYLPLGFFLASWKKVDNRS